MIEAKHKDYRIFYSEDSDNWSCSDLGIEAKTLRELKSKIDQLDLDARRVDNVKAFKLQSYGGGEETACVVTLREGNNFWIAYKGRREKVRPDEIVLDTPDNRTAIAKYRQAVDAARVARAHQDAIFAAIPRAKPELLGAIPKGVDGEKTA